MSDEFDERLVDDKPPAHDPKAWEDADWTIDEVRFASAYLRTGNAAAAWREVNADAKDDPRFVVRSYGAGQRMLRVPHVAAYCDAMRAEVRKQLNISKDGVLEELARLGYGSAGTGR